MNPKVMLFDEAASALDPELVKGVLSSVNSSHGDVTLPSRS